MAEPENAPNEKAEQGKAQSDGQATRFLPWVITVLTVLAFAAVGFIMGRVFGTRGQSQDVSAAERSATSDARGEQIPAPKAGGGPVWYYDLDPVVANLNEPGATRYIRLGLTLEFDGTMDEKEGVAFLDQRKPLMKHWLMLYLANQTIEDTQGDRNLLRMQNQISDILNEGLFPQSKPRITRVLFKENSTQ